MWTTYALFSAVFAAVTAILAKVGVKGVDSNLATAVRTAVVMVFAWGIAVARGNLGAVAELSARTWMFLALSGIATGASWLCYFRALQLGPASLVSAVDKLSLALTLVLAAVFLHEEFTLRTAVGCGLILAGTAVVVWP